jgi:TolC family type I secretion outer membrane protein
MRAALAGLAVLILVCAPALRAQQPAAPKSVTLEQAVQLTIEHSPSIVQAQGTVRSTAASQRVALGGMLPSLSLTSGASKASAQRFNSATNTLTSGASQSYTAGLTGSMDLFAGGRHLADMRRANADNLAADASLVQAQYGVALTAKTSFFSVLRNGELVRVAQAQLEQAQQGLDAANQRLAVGSATRSDVLRAQLAVTQAKQALLTGQTSETSAEYVLGRLVGENGPVTATPPPSLEPKPLAVPDAQLPTLVESQAPAVLSAEATVKSGQAAITSAKAQYFPTLRLSAGDNWLNDQAAVPWTGGNKSWNFGLGLSFPIFNGFQREQTVELASVQTENARAVLDDERLNARATLESNLAALRLAEQQIALSQEAVQVAEEDLRVQNERYRLGAGTMLDRLTSQSALVQAQTNVVNARYDYQLARAQLEALVGRSL